MDSMDAGDNSKVQDIPSNLKKAMKQAMEKQVSK
jgi:hypothetical protein